MITNTNKIDLKALTINYRNSIPACYIIEAIHPNWPMPVGSVWYRFVGNNTIEICESYVTRTCRRQGIRTFLHNSLIKDYPTIKKNYDGNNN